MTEAKSSLRIILLASATYLCFKNCVHKGNILQGRVLSFRLAELRWIDVTNLKFSAMELSKNPAPNSLFLH